MTGKHYIKTKRDKRVLQQVKQYNLPPSEQVILKMRHSVGMSFDEIACMIETSQQEAISLYQSAREHCRIMGRDKHQADIDQARRRSSLRGRRRPGKHASRRREKCAA